MNARLLLSLLSIVVFALRAGAALAAEPAPPASAPQTVEEGPQIMVRLTLLSVDPALLQKAGIKWDEPSRNRAGKATDLRTALATGTEMQARLEKLRQAGARVLSAPQLITLSGQEAKIQSGGAVPIAVDKLRIKYREFGTLMSLTPTVISPNRLLIDSEFEFSTLLTGAAENDANLLPIISGRKFSIAAKMNSGEAMLIATSDPQGPADPKSVSPMLLVCLAPEIVAAGEQTGAKFSSPADAELAALREQVSNLRLEVARLAERQDARAARPAPPAPRAVQQASATQATPPAKPSAERLVTKVYAVADLVIPAEDRIFVRIAPPGETQEAHLDESSRRLRASEILVEPAPLARKAPQAQFAPLVALISKTIAPDSWDKQGGPGAMHPFESNLSLVVSQTPQVHEQIARLLDDLRRSQDRSLQFEIEVLSILADAPERTRYDLPAEGKRISAAQASEFREFVRKGSEARVVAAPRIMLSNKQLCELQTQLSTNRDLRLILRGAIADDLESVRLNLAVNAGSAADAVRDGVCADIACGETFVLDVTDRLGPSRQEGISMLEKIPHINRLFKNVRPAAAKRTLLFITPRIHDAAELESAVNDAAAAQ